MRTRLGGLGLLVASVVANVLDLSYALHPLALRWRAQGGTARALTIIGGSLTFRAGLLIAGAILAFWPYRDTPHAP
jgi:hypothetical protein